MRLDLVEQHAYTVELKISYTFEDAVTGAPDPSAHVRLYRALAAGEKGEAGKQLELVKDLASIQKAVSSSGGRIVTSTRLPPASRTASCNSILPSRTTAQTVLSITTPSCRAAPKLLRHLL